MIKPKVFNIADKFAQDIKKSLNQMKNVAIDVCEVGRNNNDFLALQML